MRRTWIDIKEDKNTGQVEAMFYEDKDVKLLQNLYKMWVVINKLSKDLEGRMINTPEALSEGICCHVNKFGRTNKPRVKGAIKASMDAVSLAGEKIEIKASAVLDGTLTSFSPNTNFDRLFVLDFFVEGKWNGDIIIYEVFPFSKDLKVNKHETFEEQQDSTRRPRFNIFQKISNGEIKVKTKNIINIYKIK